MGAALCPLILLNAVVVAVGVDEEMCLQSTPLPVLPLWNTTSGSSSCSRWHHVPYLAATDPPDALTRPIPAGTTVSFLFVQSPLVACRSAPKSSPNMCSAESRASAQERLRRELVQRGRRRVSHRVFFNQTKLFANVAVFGVHEGVLPPSPDDPPEGAGTTADRRYYQVIRADSIYVEELPTAPQQPNMYLFQFAPPLPATYRLTLNVDFADCRGPLAALSVRGTAHGQWADYCSIVYAPAVKFRLRATDRPPPRASDGRYPDPVAAWTRSKWCDLSDTRGSYWVYPPVPSATQMSTVLRHLTPSWHHPRCPSFYARLNQLAGAAARRARHELEEAKKEIHADGAWPPAPAAASRHLSSPFLSTLLLSSPLFSSPLLSSRRAMAHGPACVSPPPLSPRHGMNACPLPSRHTVARHALVPGQCWRSCDARKATSPTRSWCSACGPPPRCALHTH